MVLIQADQTKENFAVDVDKFRFDRSSLPVNLIVPLDPDQPLIMMPELISPAEAIQALERAAGKSSSSRLKLTKG